MTSRNRPYIFAFDVGLGGTLMLGLVFILLPQHKFTILTAAAIWTILTIFGFPWAYVCYHKGAVRIPPWFLKGPHR